MKTTIDIIDTVISKDSEGFSSKEEQAISRVRAYMDERHGSRKWANMAVFSKADATFQIRRLPSVTVTPGMLIRCDTGDYKVLSVENISSLYVEIAAEKIEATKN